MDKQNKHISDDLLGRWILGELTDEEKEIVEEWGVDSEEHRRILNDSRFIAESIDQLQVMQSIDSSKAIGRVKNRIEKSGNPAKKLLFYWEKIAAIIVIPLLIYGLYQGISSYRSGSKEKITWNEISTPVGLRSNFQLPDGTKVWLNGNTTLKYPMQFSSNERMIKLQGEAFFDVVSDKKHPFVVNTGDLLVQAVGTAFNVSAFKGDSKVETALVRGKVNVLSASETGRRKIASLEPGSVAIYNRSTYDTQIISCNLDKYIAWRDGELIFRNDPLTEVLRKLGQWYNVDFQVTSSVSKEYAYTGTFQGENLHQILEYIELTTPITFVFSQPKQNNENVYMKRTIKVIKKKTR